MRYGSASIFLLQRGVIAPFNDCPYHKSNPNVLMMQATENWPGFDRADALDSAKRGRILAKREMRTRRYGRDIPVESNRSGALRIHFATASAVLSGGLEYRELDRDEQT